MSYVRKSMKITKQHNQILLLRHLINRLLIINPTNSFQTIEDSVRDHSILDIIVLSTEEIIEVKIHINNRIDHRISKRLDDLDSYCCFLLVCLEMLLVSHRINPLCRHHHHPQKIPLLRRRSAIKDNMIRHFIHLHNKLLSMVHRRHHLIKRTTRTIVVVTRIAFAVVDTTDFPNEVDPIIIKTGFSNFLLL